MQQLNTTAREVYNESPPVSDPLKPIESTPPPVPCRWTREQPIVMLSLIQVSEHDAKVRYIHGEILYVSAELTSNIMACDSLWIKYNKPFNAAVESFKSKQGNWRREIYYYILETRRDIY